MICHGSVAQSSKSWKRRRRRGMRSRRRRRSRMRGRRKQQRPSSPQESKNKTSFCEALDSLKLKFGTNKMDKSFGGRRKSSQHFKTRIKQILERIRCLRRCWDAKAEPRRAEIHFFGKGGE
jgi:hypothetical protein